MCVRICPVLIITATVVKKNGVQPEGTKNGKLSEGRGNILSDAAASPLGDGDLKVERRIIRNFFCSILTRRPKIFSITITHIYYRTRVWLE